MICKIMERNLLINKPSTVVRQRLTYQRLTHFMKILEIFIFCEISNFRSNNYYINYFYYTNKLLFIYTHKLNSVSSHFKIVYQIHRIKRIQYRLIIEIFNFIYHLCTGWKIYNEESIGLDQD